MKKYFRGYQGTVYRNQTISWIFYYLLNGKYAKEIINIEDTEKRERWKRNFREIRQR